MIRTPTERDKAVVKVIIDGLANGIASEEDLQKIISAHVEAETKELKYEIKGANLWGRHLEAKIKEFNGQWLPIESAPKDGTKILTCENGVVTENYYINIPATIRTPEMKSWNVHTIHPYGQPTHWQHLPTPPKQGIKDNLSKECGTMEEG